MRVVLDHITKKFGDFTAVSEFSAVLEDGELFRCWDLPAAEKARC